MHFSVQPAISRPSWTPLAVTVLLHLLLVLAWRWQMQTAPAAAPPERLIELVPLRPPPTPAPLVSAPPVSVPPSRPVRTSAAREAAATPAPPAPVPAAAETAPAEPPTDAPTPAPDDAPLTLEGKRLLDAAKRGAAAFDREQRKGKSGVPEEAGTPWARFREGVAAAYIDRSTATLLEKYESPDGVIIYRTTQGGKRTCRMTGAVVFGPGAAGGGSAAGNVACPKGVSWERM